MSPINVHVPIRMYVCMQKHTERDRGIHVHINMYICIYLHLRMNICIVMYQSLASTVYCSGQNGSLVRFSRGQWRRAAIP